MIGCRARGITTQVTRAGARWKTWLAATRASRGTVWRTEDEVAALVAR